MAVVVVPTTDITCQVTLRYKTSDTSSSSSSKLTDIYLIMTGERDVTRKILLNSFEAKSSSSSSESGCCREKVFEFHCRDIGKILHVNVSSENDENPRNSVY